MARRWSQLLVHPCHQTRHGTRLRTPGATMCEIPHPGAWSGRGITKKGIVNPMVRTPRRCRRFWHGLCGTRAEGTSQFRTPGLKGPRLNQRDCVHYAEPSSGCASEMAATFRAVAASSYTERQFGSGEGMMKELIISIVQSLVDKPHEVRIREVGEKWPGRNT